MGLVMPSSNTAEVKGWVGKVETLSGHIASGRGFTDGLYPAGGQLDPEPDRPFITVRRVARPWRRGHPNHWKWMEG